MTDGVNGTKEGDRRLGGGGGQESVDEEEDDLPLQMAKDVYVLMHSDVRVSRFARAHWYLCHLNQEIDLWDPGDKLQQQEEKLCAVGCVPGGEGGGDGRVVRCELGPKTNVHFIGQRNRFVYLLDLSPSAANVNVRHSASPIEILIPALRNSLTGLASPFPVPGSLNHLVLRPVVYVTIIAWTPFLTMDTPLVLCQGWYLLQHNVDELMDRVVNQLHDLEERIAQYSQMIQRDIESIRAESQQMMGGLFDHGNGSGGAGHSSSSSSNRHHQQQQLQRLQSSSSSLTPSVPMTTSDAGFINMIRTGVLALQLLPRNSTAGLIVVGDGTMAIPDIDNSDSVLNLLRSKTISVSFLMVSSPYFPQSAFSRLPYHDLMLFISRTTFGVFLPEAPPVISSSDCEMNIYNEAFFCWSFRKALDGLDLTKYHCHWDEQNKYFRFIVSENDTSIRKKVETEVSSSLQSVMSCRLREGFTVNEVYLGPNSTLELKLSLHWKLSSMIHYIVQSRWPPHEEDDEEDETDCVMGDEDSRCKVTIYFEGDYDTIHDITCQRDKTFPSRDRNAVIRKFYTNLQHLGQLDKLLVHLESFPYSKDFYKVPDSVASGNPLFAPRISSSTSSSSTVAASTGSVANFSLYNLDFPHTAFATFWKPVCSLDINVWHRWMHTHRINVVLCHDFPLPKHFVLPNASGRFTPVQCRKAAALLTDALKDFSTFALLEATSYIKYLYKGKGAEGGMDPPTSFYIIRVTSKPPCVVIWLAFPMGTCGLVRQQELTHVKQLIQRLGLQHRTASSSSSSSWATAASITAAIRNGSDTADVPEIPACYLLAKPVERILIRYERQPQDFFNLLEPVHLSILPRSESPVLTPRLNLGSTVKPSGGAFMTLARYLRNERWVWNLLDSSMISMSFLARLLSTLLKLRLKQGFRFAHSNNGIQTMALELPIRTVEDETPQHANGGGHREGIGSDEQTILIQYVTFPPNSRDYSLLDDLATDDTEEIRSLVENNHNPTKFITEVWVEPQDGVICSKGYLDLFDGLRFDRVPSVIFQLDRQIIQILSTIEYINSQCRGVMSESVTVRAATNGASSSNYAAQNSSSSSIKSIPFSYDLVSLVDMAPQTEILFSALIQGLYQGEDEMVAWMDHDLNVTNKPNNKLLEMFTEELRVISDHEILLTDSECAALVPHFQASSQNRPQLLKFPPRYDSSSSSSLGTTIPQPKWKCFIKWISTNHFLVTLVPFSYQDLKALLLSKEANFDEDNSSICVVSKPMPETHTAMNLDLQTAGEDLGLGGSAGVTQRGSSMRKRTQSIDNSDAAVGASGRRSSVSNGDIGTLGTEKVPRARTHTFSYLNRGGERGGRALGRGHYQQSSSGVKGDGSSSQDSSSSSGGRSHVNARKSDVNRVVGALTLPVYTYDCQEQEVTQMLLEQRKQTASETVDMITRPEADAETITMNTGKRRKLGKAEGPKILIQKFKESYIAAIQKAYVRSFVAVVFQSLQNNLSVHSVHSYDIQQAIDFCQDDFVMAVDISNFLKNVCDHVSSTFNGAELDQELLEPQTPIDFNSLDQIMCCQSSSNHVFMKKKFTDLLRNTFEPVPSLNDSFFFFNPERPQHRQRRDTKDTANPGNYFEEDMTEFKMSDLNAGKFISLDDKNCYSRNSYSGTNTPQPEDPGSLSLLSNIDSEPSEFNCSQEDNFEDTDPPFFLQLSVSFRYAGTNVKNFPVSELPTCLVEIMQALPPTGDLLWSLDQITATLDFLCITLPPDKQSQADTFLPVGSLGSTLSQLPLASSPPMLQLVASSSSISSSSSSCIADTKDNLPDTQKKALQALVEELSWMIRNEIIFSLTRASAISFTILDRVANHIQDSVSKPGCSVQSIPLTFVFGHTKSLELFNTKLAHLKLPFFEVRKCDSILYFVQQPQPQQQQQQQQLSTNGCDRPTYWLMLKVNENDVLIYFQYREGEMSTVLPWRQAQLQLVSSLKAIIKWTNQQMLLLDLHESRFCNRLLEAESDDEAWSLEGEDADHTLLEASLKFKPGFFACPLVWDARFHLHPRLHHHSHDGLSLGMSALKLALDAAFAVANRHMFVYMDDKRDVFYFKIFESVSRLGQGGQLAAKPQVKDCEDSETLSRTSSSSSASGHSKLLPHDNSDVVSTSSGRPASSRSISVEQHHSIDMKFFGVGEPGVNVKSDLVAFFQMKLDERLVDILSNMLQRNPMSKLTPDDVDFLQRPGIPPNWVELFSISNCVEPHLASLMYYVRQNLSLVVIRPKFVITGRSQFHAPNDDRPGEAYIFNQAAGHAGGHRGLACITLDVVDRDHRAIAPILTSPLLRALSVSTGDDAEWFMEIGKGAAPDKDIIFKLCFWEQGRIERDKLVEKLRVALKHSLWETKTEAILQSQPVIVPSEDSYKGSLGRVNPVFRWLSEEWLPLALKIEVPSVSVYQIPLPTRCNSKLLLKEFVSLVRQYFSATEPFVFCKSTEGDYIAIDRAPSGSQLSCTHLDNFLLILRPDSKSAFSSFSSTSHGHLRFKPSGYTDGDKSVPQTPGVTSPVGSMSRSLRHSSGNVDYSIGSNEDSVSRQCLVVVKLLQSVIKIKTYNLAREFNDRFVRQSTSLAHWLSARSSLSNSIAAQKLGLFHNQAMLRKVAHNISTFGASLKQVDHIVKNASPPARVQSPSKDRQKSEMSLLFAYRDNKPKVQMHLVHETKKPKDVTSRHGRQMLNMSDLVEEKLAKLFLVWQKRGGDILTEEGIRFLKGHSRIVHFCLTPLLFLPKWRFEAYLPRKKGYIFAEKLPPMTKVFRRSSVDERNNLDLIDNYTQEYCQYIQTFGFFAVKTRGENKPDSKHRRYLQKCIPGGILLFEIGISEPFFYTCLYALEETRLPTKKLKPPSSQVVTSLVDECDNIKYKLHLHSFTYDFHLRVVQGFVAGRPTHLRIGYNIVHFLSDFIKYYSKGPNFARNMVRAGSVIFHSKTIPPEQLFNYVLSHETTYNFGFLRLEPILVDKKQGEFDCDFVLTRQTTHKLSFSYPSDLRKTDEFDSSLIVAIDRFASTEDVLVLQYYIVLTSKRELYPKNSGDRNQGQFKAVSSTLESRAHSAQKTITEEDFLDIELEHEPVLYVGYYSCDEQSMDHVMKLQEKATECTLLRTLERATTDCRKDCLWFKLVSPGLDLTQEEFHELTQMTVLTHVPDASAVLNPKNPTAAVTAAAWDSLVHSLGARYGQRQRMFDSQDEVTQVLVINGSKDVNACAEIVMNSVTSEVDLYLVSKNQLHEMDSESESVFAAAAAGMPSSDVNDLIRELTYAICYHLWAHNL